MDKGELTVSRSGNYLPLQPGFELNNDYYVQLKQSRDVMNKNMVLFYQFKTSKKSTESAFAVPDGCIDIIFCCNPDKPSANCCGTVLQSKQVVFEADSEYFGVRYLPEQGIHLMKDLINKEVPLTDIIAKDSWIIDKIVNIESFEERTKLYDKLVNNYFFKVDNVPKLIEYCIKKIYQSKGNLNVEPLAVETGYSVRYLRKKFEEAIGISPKLFSEIVRFQNSLSMLLEHSQYELWDVVSENGYYDQAHFINQFKKFSNFTPVRFKKLFGESNR